MMILGAPSGSIPRSVLVSNDSSSDTRTINEALHGARESTDTVSKRDTDRRIPIYSYKGTSTISQALSIFNRINDTVSSSVEAGVRFASRELFYKTDMTDDIDLCADTVDSSRAPYTIECVQKLFLQAGGQESGTMYPSAKTMPIWNRLTTWLKVKQAIHDIHTKTQSSDRVIQELAIVQFYGPPTIHVDTGTRMPGVEIFWFRNNPSLNMADSPVFLGRRIRPMAPSIRIANVNVSMVFFTSIRLSSPWSGAVGVVSDDKVAVHLNRPIGVGYVEGLKRFGPNDIVALTHQQATRWKADWSFVKSGPNIVSGFWFQGNGGKQFKLQYHDATKKTWLPFSADSFFLVQDPYAPMISFQVYQAAEDYGANFNFADRRMSGLLMKWYSLTGTPGWNYSKGPLGLPCISFRPDSSITLKTTFKLYSFMTLTLLLTFHGLPNNSVNSQEYFYMAGALGRIAIRVIGTGKYGQGVLQLYCEGGEDAPRTIGVKTVRQGVPYLLVLHVLRENEMDIYSVNGLSVAIEELGILQDSHGELDYSARVIVSNPIAFSNPDTMESRSMVIGNGKFDVVWLRLYDYYLSRNGIMKEIAGAINQHKH